MGEDHRYVHVACRRHEQTLMHAICFTPKVELHYALIGEMRLIASVYDRKTVLGMRGRQLN